MLTLSPGFFGGDRLDELLHTADILSVQLTTMSPFFRPAWALTIGDLVDEDACVFVRGGRHPEPR